MLPRPRQIAISASPPPPPRFVHAVRDPLEMCVSAYQYHLLGAEPWLVQPMRDLNGSTMQQYYKSLGPEEGVRFECKRMVLELVETALVFNATRGMPNCLTLRLEEFAKDFDGTARRLFAFLGSGTSLTEVLVNSSAKYDLARAPPEDSRHVSTPTSKQPLRDMVLSDALLGRLMAGLRELLGYHHLSHEQRSHGEQPQHHHHGTGTDGTTGGGGAGGGVHPLTELTLSPSAHGSPTAEELCVQLRALCATTRVGFIQWCSYGRVLRGRLPSLAECGETLPQRSKLKVQAAER